MHPLNFKFFACLNIILTSAEGLHLTHGRTKLWTEEEETAASNMFLKYCSGSKERGKDGNISWMCKRPRPESTEVERFLQDFKTENESQSQEKQIIFIESPPSLYKQVISVIGSAVTNPKTQIYVVPRKDELSIKVKEGKKPEISLHEPAVSFSKDKIDDGDKQSTISTIDMTNRYIQSGNSTNIHSDNIKSISKNNNTSIQSDNNTDIKSDNNTNIPKINNTDIQIDNNADIQSDNTTDIQSDNTTDIQSDNTTDIQSDSTTDIQIDNNTDILKNNNTNIPKIDNTNIQSGNISTDSNSPNNQSVFSKINVEYSFTHRNFSVGSINSKGQIIRPGKVVRDKRNFSLYQMLRSRAKNIVEENNKNKIEGKIVEISRSKSILVHYRKRNLSRYGSVGHHSSAKVEDAVGEGFLPNSTDQSLSYSKLRPVYKRQ